MNEFNVGDLLIDDLYNYSKYIGYILNINYITNAITVKWYHYLNNIYDYNFIHKYENGVMYIKTNHWKHIKRK